MNVSVTLSLELKTWLTHNLERGCAPEQLIQSMVERRFEPAVARGLVGAFAEACAAGRTITDSALSLEVDAHAYSSEGARLAAGNTIPTSDRIIPVVFRMQRPAVAVLADVLSEHECDQLIAMAGPRLTPSTVVDPQSGVNRVVEYRNSEGMFFRLRETALIARLDERLSQIMNSPVDHGEGLQVLRYGPGTRSTPHYDFLLPSNTANEQSLARSGQRISSLVVYLNDVPSGGETIFPNIGLSVSPRRGYAVYFEYCNSVNQLDHLTLHAGGQVGVGEKWAATKWMRQKRFVTA